MCRVMFYLGKEAQCIHDLLFASDNALVHQTYAPKLMKGMLNLAGLGFCAWSDTGGNQQEPFHFKTTDMPFFDENLYRLSKKILSNCFLAHIRGVRFSVDEVVNDQNVHPFRFDLTEIAFAHNGFLPRFREMKYDLFHFIKPELIGYINGTTDSETIYAVFLSQLPDYRKKITKEMAYDATIKTLNILKEIREKLNIQEAAPLNFFISNGEFVLVTRFVFNYGRLTRQTKDFVMRYHSLWATFGEHYGLHEGKYQMYGSTKHQSILFVSEPLTIDTSTWLELPEYSITTAWMESETVRFRSTDLFI